MFSKKKKATSGYEDEYEDEEEEDDLVLETELTEEPQPAEQKPAVQPGTSSVYGEPDDADAEDDDEYEDDEEEFNDAEDEEERYLLRLARQEKLKKNILVIIAGAVGVAIITILLVFLFTHRDPNQTVAKVGENEVTLSEFAFAYFYSIDYFGQVYGSEINSYGIDLSGDLTQKICNFNPEITWHEYFVQQAMERLEEDIALADKAFDAGWQFEQADIDTAQAYLDSMSNYATQLGMNPQDIIKFTYGEYVNDTSLSLSLMRMSLAQRFRAAEIGDLAITDEQIEAYFEENRETYQTATYRMMIFSDANVDENDTRTAEEKANAMFAEITDEQSFIDLAYEYATENQKQSFENSDVTLAEGIYAKQFTDSVAAEWLFDEARQPGDMTVLDLQSGYAVTYFIGFGRDTANTIDVRHILVQPETKGNEESQAAAKAEAERIYQMWLDGAADEAYFAELAAEYTADGNGAQGGIYENVYVGQMVQNFNDWCFDESREPGDSGIVETEYGYHIMYFVEKNEENWKASIRSILQSQQYTDYRTALLDEYSTWVDEGAVTGLKRYS